MKFFGVSESELRDIVQYVSTARYSGNVRIRDSRDLSNSRGGRCQATFRVNDSNGPGARRASSGRKGPYACWHVVRDILRELYVRNDKARVISTLATYNGQADFEQKFPDTYSHEVGNIFMRNYFGALCDC